MPRSAARDAGLKARHAEKLARTTPKCRYINEGERQGLCTAEAVDAVGEIKLCTRHLALALELLLRSPEVAYLLRSKVA